MKTNTSLIIGGLIVIGAVYLLTRKQQQPIVIQTTGGQNQPPSGTQPTQTTSAYQWAEFGWNVVGDVLDWWNENDSNPLDEFTLRP